LKLQATRSRQTQSRRITLNLYQGENHLVEEFSTGPGGIFLENISSNFWSYLEQNHNIRYSDTVSTNQYLRTQNYCTKCGWWKKFFWWKMTFFHQVVFPLIYTLYNRKPNYVWLINTAGWFMLLVSQCHSKDFCHLFLLDTRMQKERDMVKRCSIQ